MEKLNRSFEEVKKSAEQRQGNPTQVNFSYFPQFGTTTSEPRMTYPTQPMPSLMFPYQNYMSNPIGNQVNNDPSRTLGSSIFDEYNNRGAMVDNLVIQNQSEPSKNEEVIKAKQEEVSEKEPAFEKNLGCFCG